MENCFCGSDICFLDCCKPLLEGREFANTAEKLMRSRYSAFCTSNVDYILSTYDTETRPVNDKDDILNWSESVQFTKLEVVSLCKGLSSDIEGRVVFNAHFIENGENRVMSEDSAFRKIDGRWFYIDGKTVDNLEYKKLDRNSPCHCGSGRKYKKCCLNK